MSVYEGADAEGMGARNDPRYDEAVAHLQAGEWAQGIDKLEALAASYPDEAWLRVRLEDARMKAVRDGAVRVQPRRSFARWRPLIVRLLLVLAAALLTWLTINTLRGPVTAYFERRRASADIQELYNTGTGLLQAAADASPEDAAGWLAEAEMKFNAVLALQADHAEATARLAEIPALRRQNTACREAARLFASDQPADWTRARTLYGELNAERPGFCDASAAITELNRRLTRADLEAGADAAYDAGDCTAAIGGYRALRTEDSSYHRAKVEERLFDCYLRLGRAIVEQTPPPIERLPEALSYFEQALALRPKDAAAGAEQRLASLFLAARKAADEGQAAEAVRRWEGIVQERPGYLGGAAPPMLYDAYIRLGDAARDAGDCARGYDYYTRAAQLAGVDTALAVSRATSVRACLTPTPTPRPTATPIPYRPPTAAPPTVPPPPLQQFRGQIVFRSGKEGFEGYWVMNPDGSNKRFIGESPELDKEYAALYAKEQYAPDGRCRVYNTTDPGRGDATPQLYMECRDDSGTIHITRLTAFAKMCYDPVWSPAGDRIAFISQERTSDDLWVLDLSPNGQPWNYTPNDWEWDKHPSWSPDGRKIVFWSNREGTRQIYVIDANGQNLTKISGVAPWWEWDPIWIK